MQNLVDLDRWPSNEQTHFGQVKLTIAQFFRPAAAARRTRAWCRTSASRYGRRHRIRREHLRQRVAVDAHRRRAARALWQLRADAAAARCTARGTRRQGQGIPVVVAGRRRVPRRARQEVRVAQRSRAPRRARPPGGQAQVERQAERKALGLDPDPLADDASDDGLQVGRAQRRRRCRREKAAEKRPDPLLRESAAILADATTCWCNDQKLTAQVLPEIAARRRTGRSDGEPIGGRIARIG